MNEKKTMIIFSVQAQKDSIKNHAAPAWQGRAQFDLLIEIATRHQPGVSGECRCAVQRRNRSMRIDDAMFNNDISSSPIHTHTHARF
jgi:hypothetical protein